MDDYNGLIELRHTLHQHAELSGKEYQTRAVLLAALSQLRPDRIISPIAETGFVAVYDGQSPGPTVVLRAELDALPVSESCRKPYQSLEKSVSHCCGHDGHMAILIGVARRLHRRRPRKGRVALLFQPAEEIGKGAAAVMEDPHFADLAPDAVFALHNLPGKTLGSVLVKPGVMNCASVGVKVRWKGKPAHASQPENGISPAACMATLIQQWPQLAHAPACSDQGALVTIVHSRLGEPSFGIIPGSGQLWATLRCETDKGLSQLIEASRRLADSSADDSGLEVRMTIHEHFIATQNSPQAAAVVAEAAEQLGFGIVDLQQPLRWSEDFGRFTARISGALFAMGAGSQTAPLHRPEYDFPDQMIEDGVALYLEIIRGWMSN